MTTKIKSVDLNDDELTDLEKALMLYLDVENNVAYEFMNNDYNCAYSAGIMNDDIEYIKQAERIKVDVDRIVKNHENVKAMVKRLIAQAKIANQLHKNIVSRREKINEHR